MSDLKEALIRTAEQDGLQLAVYLVEDFRGIDDEHYFELRLIDLDAGVVRRVVRADDEQDAKARFWWLYDKHFDRSTRIMDHLSPRLQTDPYQDNPLFGSF